METNLVLYSSYFDHFSFFEEMEEENNRLLIHYASCLLEKGLPDEDELEIALHKAIRTVTIAQLPAEKHFRKIFVAHRHDLKTDWLVSDLGLRLIVLNAEVSNPLIARLQIDILANTL